MPASGLRAESWVKRDAHCFLMFDDDAEVVTGNVLPAVRAAAAAAASSSSSSADDDDDGGTPQAPPAPTAAAEPHAVRGRAVLVVRRDLRLEGASRVALGVKLRGREVVAWKDVRALASSGGGSGGVAGALRATGVIAVKRLADVVEDTEHRAERDVYTSQTTLLMWPPAGGHDPDKYRVSDDPDDDSAAAAAAAAAAARSSAGKQEEDDAGGAGATAAGSASASDASSGVVVVPAGTYSVPFMLGALPAGSPGSFEEVGARVVVACDQGGGGQNMRRGRTQEVPSPLATAAARPDDSADGASAMGYAMAEGSVIPKDLGPSPSRSRVRYEATLFLSSDGQLSKGGSDDGVSSSATAAAAAAEPSSSGSDQTQEGKPQKSKSSTKKKKTKSSFQYIFFKKQVLCVLPSPLGDSPVDVQECVKMHCAPLEATEEASFLMGGEPLRMTASLPRGGVCVAGGKLPLRVALDNQTRNRTVNVCKATLYRVTTLRDFDPAVSHDGDEPDRTFERRVAVKGVELPCGSVAAKGGTWSGLVQFPIPDDMAPTVSNTTYVSVRYDLVVAAEVSFAAFETTIAFQGVVVVHPRAVATDPRLQAILAAPIPPPAPAGTAAAGAAGAAAAGDASAAGAKKKAPLSAIPVEGDGAAAASGSDDDDDDDDDDDNGGGGEGNHDGDGDADGSSTARDAGEADATGEAAPPAAAIAASAAADGDAAGDGQEDASSPAPADEDDDDEEGFDGEL